MALPNESRRAPERGRRPQDAPRLAAVPNPPATGPAQPGPLPGVLAQAVLDQSAPAAEETTAPPGPRPEPAAGQPGGGQVAVVESQSAAEAERAIRWLGVTYRPPDVWRERQPSLAEEWAFVMDGSHLPEEGLWRALARGYAAPALGLISALHLAIWVLRSPARHATAWAVGLVAVISAMFML